MIRAAYIFPHGDVGGAEIATLRILGAHDRSRVEAFAVLLSRGPLAERLQGVGVEVVTASVRPRLRDRAGRRQLVEWLSTVLAERGAGVQHNVMAWTHAVVGRAGTGGDIPVLWYQHNRPKVSSVIDWCAAWRDTDCIVANSRFTATRQRFVNPRRHPVRVVQPPVHAAQPTLSRDHIRQSLELIPEEVALLLPARLQRWKGQDVAIRAIAQAKERRRLRLLVVGDTMFGLEAEYLGHLQALVDDLGVRDRVQFLGFRTDLPDLYLASDIVLHTSREPEPFGLVVGEALSAGRPVIATRAGGILEQITHRENGWLIPGGRVEALADAIDHLVGDPALRNQLAAGAAQTPVATPATAAAEFEDIYERLVDAR